jgi:hypothetical protein
MKKAYLGKVLLSAMCGALLWTAAPLRATTTTNSSPNDIAATYTNNNGDTYINNSSLTVTSGAQFVNDSAGIVTNNGILATQAGCNIYNWGSLTDSAGASISNTGVYQNGGFDDELGTFTNAAATSNFQNIFGATFDIENGGVLNNNADAFAQNWGTLNVEAGGQLNTVAGSDFQNQAAGANLGIINVYGTVNDAGEIDQYGGVINVGNGGVFNDNTSGDGIYSTINVLAGGTWNEVSGNGYFTSWATFNNAGTLNNDQNFTNGGTLNNEAGAYLTDSGYFVTQGSLYNLGTISVTAAASLNNLYGGYLENDNYLENDGIVYNNSSEIENYGLISSTAGASFINYDGYVGNLGTFENLSQSAIYNQNYGEFSNSGGLDNSGTINNDLTSEIDNFGTLTNTATGVITNNADWYQQDGNGFYNEGTIVNMGAINNAGTLVGSVTNTAQFYNGTDSGFCCGSPTGDDGFNEDYDATLVNATGGSFSNLNHAYFGNDWSGTVINSGTFLNDATSQVDNYGLISNTAGGVITNNAAFASNDYGDDLNNAFYNEDQLLNWGTVNNTGGYLINGINDNFGYYSAYLLNAAGGVIANSGGATLVNSGNGEIDNYGTITNDATSSVYNDNTVINEAGGFVNNAGYVENDSELINFGLISNTAGASVSNTAYLENDGTFVNLSMGALADVNGGEIKNELGATLSNAGSFTVDSESEVDNYGTLTNTATGVINTGSNWWDNNSGFYNENYINNAGQINNSNGTLYNGTDNLGCCGGYPTGNDGFNNDYQATIVNQAGASINNTNNAEFGNDYDGTVVNAGVFMNDSTSEVDNFGLISNTATGTIINEANNSSDYYNNDYWNAFFNEGTINNYGAISNTAGGELVNGMDAYYNSYDANLNNEVGGVIDNFNGSDIYNYGNGIITNAGTINNDATSYFETDNYLDNLNSGVIATAGELYNDGELDNYGQITITATGELYNDGTVYVASGGTITDQGYIYSDGEIDNYGAITVTGTGTFENDDATLNNYDSGVIQVQAQGLLISEDHNDFYNYGTFTNLSQGAFANTTGAYFENDGTLTNNGLITNSYNTGCCGSTEIYNYGTFTNGATGKLVNNSKFVNEDTMSNLAGGVITTGTTTNVNGYQAYFENDGLLDNFGTLTLNQYADEFDNEDTLYNESGAVINNLNDWDGFYNDGYIKNFAGAVFNNNGTNDGAYLETEDYFENDGTLNNTDASLYNYDEFVNNGTVNNTDASFYTDGSFINGAGSVFINNDAYLENYDGAGFFENSFGATISNTNDSEIDNSATFLNFGTLTNDSTSYFYNENGGNLTNGFGAVLSNAGYFENDGQLQNYGSITNTGASDGNGLVNYGQLMNEAGGIIANYGVLSNTANSIVANQGVLTNGATGWIDNQGEFGNMAGGTLDNAGMIVNEAGNELSNEGLLTNESTGVITNTGATLQNSGGVFNNNGAVNGGLLENINAGTLVNNGTIAVNGFTQDSTSKLVLEVTPKGVADISVAGNASLGGTLQLVYAPGIYSNASYTLVTATGTVTGSFAHVSDASPFAAGTVGYSTHIAELTNSSMSVDPSNDSIYTGLASQALLEAGQSDLSLLHRMDGLALGNGMDGASAPSTGDVTGVWEKNTGGTVQQNGTSTVAGYYEQGGGISAGIDHRWGNFLGGIAFGDSASMLRQGDGETGSFDSPSVNLYGGVNLGPVGVDLALGYAMESFTANRPITSVGQNAASTYTGSAFSGALQANYPVALGAGLKLLPKIGVEFASLSNESFSEKGSANFDLAVASQSASSVAPFVGLTLAKGFDGMGWNFSPRLDLGFSDQSFSSLMGSANVGGGSFDISGVTPTAGQFSAGIGFTAAVIGDLSLSGEYQATPSSNLVAQSLAASLRYQFGSQAGK